VILRPYQENALQALEAHWNNGGGAALLDMATATGKSLVIAEAVRRRHAVNPSLRSLIAVHVRELVEQDVDALLTVWPAAPYGVCCEGLGRRDHAAPIIIGTIQSLARDADRLGRRDLVFVDEVQLVPRSGDGQYLSLFDVLRSRAPDLQLVGASATPYRLDSGYLHKGDGALFEKIAFSYQIAEGIKDGYLSPLRSKATNTRIDVRGVHIRGGEFMRRGRSWPARSRATACGASACSWWATKTSPRRRLSFLRSFNRLRVWVGPMAATCGSTFVGPALTPIGD
jgi:DNA repair protein RadD